MSVYISGMEMPDKCGHCRFANAFDCTVTGSFISTHSIRQPDCPLVPVPPHGRLIDESEIPWCVDWYAGRKRYYTTPKTVEHLPTIIPADKEEEG